MSDYFLYLIYKRHDLSLWVYLIITFLIPTSMLAKNPSLNHPQLDSMNVKQNKTPHFHLLIAQTPQQRFEVLSPSSLKHPTLEKVVQQYHQLNRDITQLNKQFKKKMRAEKGELQQQRLTQSYEQQHHKLSTQRTQMIREAISAFHKVIQNSTDIKQSSFSGYIHYLALFYFELETHTYYEQEESYNTALDQYYDGILKQEPIMPKLKFDQTLFWLKKLRTSSPHYHLNDEIEYLIAYCHAQSQQHYHYYEAWTRTWPTSRRNDEVWFILAEHYFEKQLFSKAIKAYKNVMKTKDKSSIQGLKSFAYYKLIWSHFLQKRQNLQNKQDPLKEKSSKTSKECRAIAQALTQWKSIPSTDSSRTHHLQTEIHNQIMPDCFPSSSTSSSKK